MFNPWRRSQLTFHNEELLLFFLGGSDFGTRRNLLTMSYNYIRCSVCLFVGLHFGEAKHQEDRNVFPRQKTDSLTQMYSGPNMFDFEFQAFSTEAFTPPIPGKWGTKKWLKPSELHLLTQKMQVFPRFKFWRSRNSLLMLHPSWFILIHCSSLSKPHLWTTDVLFPTGWWIHEGVEPPRLTGWLNSLRVIANGPTQGAVPGPLAKLVYI